VDQRGDPPGGRRRINPDHDPPGRLPPVPRRCDPDAVAPAE
jgi:hypothetical protein